MQRSLPPRLQPRYRAKVLEACRDLLDLDMRDLDEAMARDRDPIG